MPDRILDFSEEPARLSVRNQNLVVDRRDKPEVTIPLAEIAAVVFSHPQVSASLAVLAGLAAAGACIVVCDEKRLPVGMQLPLQAHHVQSERIEAQVTATKPLCKRLWQRIVRQKIAAQAAVLRARGGEDAGLAALGDRVRSGDPENVEAQAARRYWPALFQDPRFRREREAPGMNALLNYGYAILRAMTARAVCAVGLHPSVGLHHHNRYSQFTLADDLMEPFRPIVDRAALVIGASHELGDPLGKEPRAAMLNELLGRFWWDDEQRSLFDILSRCASSLAASFLKREALLALPPCPRLLDPVPRSETTS